MKHSFFQLTRVFSLRNERNLEKTYKLTQYTGRKSALRAVPLHFKNLAALGNSREKKIRMFTYEYDR